MSLPIYIALVDDEEDVEFLYTAQLRKEIAKKEVKLLYFNRAQKLLDYVYTHKDEIKIIILVSDINMPGMNGITLVEKLQESHPSIDLYLSSAYDQSTHKDKIEKCAISGYLEKPVDFTKVKEIIQKKIREIS